MNMDYYQISAEELGQNAKVPLLKLGDSGEVFYELALEMIGEIEKNNAVGRRTVFICPVGPVGPMAPAAPVAPVAPVGPAGPTGPIAPVAPVGPVGPTGPMAPTAPEGPGMP